MSKVWLVNIHNQGKDAGLPWRILEEKDTERTFERMATAVLFQVPVSTFSRNDGHWIRAEGYLHALGGEAFVITKEKTFKVEAPKQDSLRLAQSLALVPDAPGSPEEG